MHACLNVDEIVRLITRELVAREAYASPVALGCCCKSFEEPVLDTLWEVQTQLLPLLMSLTGDVWNPGTGRISSKRPPTTSEWARFRKYARRMRKLTEHDSMRTLSADVLPVLQLCATKGPLFPNLKSLEFQLTVGDPIPFIPLFLSAGITAINIKISGAHLCNVMVASLVTSLPVLCPRVQEIDLRVPTDPVIDAAVSRMLLATNRNTLQSLRVDSPLTEEAHKWIFRLPNLRELWVVTDGDVSLPSALLPGLTNLTIDDDYGSDWSQIFRGATLDKLESFTFFSGMEHPEDFLETFERVALSISAQKTLSELYLYNNTLPWNPSYSCLLPFTRLTHLGIVYPCHIGCSSTVDDDVITNLAQAMPRLETLRLGDSPCSKIPTGVTVKGLVALAHHCLGLSTLRLHLKVDSFCAPMVNAGVVPDPRFTVARRECALKDLEVGYIIVPKGSALVVALTLLRIFPHIQCIDRECEDWDWIADAIRVSRQIDDNLAKITSANGG